MNIHLHSKWGELPLTGEYPQSRKDMIFPGAELQIAESVCHGYFHVIQQFDLAFFTIRYCCFSSIEKDMLIVLSGAPVITFRLGTFHSHHVISKQLGEQVFHERGYNCFYEPDSTAQYPMEPFEHYIFLDILLKKDYMLYLEYYFPETRKLIKKARARAAAKMTLPNQVAQAEVWRWQEELHDWCFDKNRKKEDGNIIGHKLIEQSIRSIQPAQVERGIGLSRQEIKRIYDIAEMIDDSEEPYTILRLASIVGISPHKLEAGFKEIYGHPILKHKFEQRMLLALRLTSAIDATVEKIAGHVGYTDPDKFYSDFEKRFGYAPFQKAGKA